jgi:hypothetical protein
MPFILIGSMEVYGEAVPTMERTMELAGDLMWQYNKPNMS